MENKIEPIGNDDKPQDFFIGFFWGACGTALVCFAVWLTRVLLAIALK